MTSELIFAFIGYALVTSITPGPNNTMLLASGVNFGISRSVPHILGINLGFGAMVLAVGFGVEAALRSIPDLFVAMKIVGISYLLYLAWQIAHDGPVSNHEASVRRPMTFVAAAAFQWVNPKCWIMVLGAIATYLPSTSGWRGILTIAALYVLANLPCIVAWTSAGVMLRRLLTTPSRVRLFNRTMALILCLSIIPSFADLVRTSNEWGASFAQIETLMRLAPVAKSITGGDLK